MQLNFEYMFDYSSYLIYLCKFIRYKLCLKYFERYNYIYIYIYNYVFFSKMNRQTRDKKLTISPIKNAEMLYMRLLCTPAYTSSSTVHPSVHLHGPRQRLSPVRRPTAWTTACGQRAGAGGVAARGTRHSRKMAPAGFSYEASRRHAELSAHQYTRPPDGRTLRIRQQRRLHPALPIPGSPHDRTSGVAKLPADRTDR